MSEQILDDKLDRRYRWFSISLPDSRKKLIQYIFRGTTREELRLASTKKTTDEAESFLLRRALYGIKDLDSMLYGNVIRLTQEIYKVSGITDEAITFKEAVAWIQSAEGAMEAAAVSYVQGCSFQTLYNCDPSEYAKYCLLGKFNFESVTGSKLEDLYGVVKEEAVPTVKDDNSTPYVNVSKKEQSVPVEGGNKQFETYSWMKKPSKKND